MFGHSQSKIIFVGLPHNDRNVEAIPRIFFTNSLLLDVGRRTGRVGIQQVPELRMVEDEPAVVADGRVALRAGAEALLPRRHLFLWLRAPRGSRFFVDASFLCLNSPHLSTQFLRLPGMFKGGTLGEAFMADLWQCPNVFLATRWVLDDSCPLFARKLVSQYARPQCAFGFAATFAAHDPYGSTLPCSAALRHCGQTLWATTAANSARAPQ